MLAAFLREVAAGALDLVFAPMCVACGRTIPPEAERRIVCALCWSGCRPVPAPRCPRCWAHVAPGTAPAANCGGCADWPAAARVARSAFVLGGPVRNLVHALKYRGWSAAALPMAERMARLPVPGDVEREARVVVPVPTSAAHVRERGYNQAALLAEAYAQATGRYTAPELLVRTRQAHTQTSLHPDERRANVARAFSVPDAQRGRVAGRHLVVVDDVWTTGATALACTDALVRAGARVVSVVTFARVFPELARTPDDA